MAGISQIVLDASVALKWFLKEDYSEEAGQLRDEYLSGTLEIVVPALVYYEITNVLRYKPDYSIRDLEDCASSLDGMQLNTVSWNEAVGKISISLAYKFGITAYDASYLAVAHYCQCKLITCDEKLLSKVEYDGSAMHLRNFCENRQN